MSEQPTTSELRGVVIQDVIKLINVASEVYRPDGVLIWIKARNRLLDGKSPLECVANGETKRAVNLLHALAEGVVM